MQQLRLASIFMLAFIFSFTACKKETASAGTTDSLTELTVHTHDELEVSGSMDAVANDANLAVESNPTFTGRVQQQASVVCDASIVFSTSGGNKLLTLTYDGTSCAGPYTRTGVVTLSLPSGVQWKDAGAALTLTYINVKITRLTDNKSMVLNGTETITNVSGGRLINLATQAGITHTITSSNMAITFDNGTQRTWQVARQRVFTYANGINITITGLHTEGNNTGIAAWGATRLGTPFTTSITAPLVIRQDCNFRLTGGQVQHTRLAATASATFGLDASGKATSCPSTGSYYYKFTLMSNSNGSTYGAIFPY